MNVSYTLRRIEARLYTKYLADFIFIHINKTGGSSVERALGLPFQHSTALQIRRDIGERRWAKRFSFTIVRNPWDRVASHYHYRVKTNQTGLRDHPVPFNDWVRLTYGERHPRYYDAADMFMPQTKWICDEKEGIIVDFVGRFERLEEDFNTICSNVGKRAVLPHLKKSANGDYREIYNDESVEIIGEVFAIDLANFGYRFE